MTGPTPRAKTRRVSLFLRSAALSTLGVGVVLAFFAFAIVRHERQLLRNNLEAQASLIAAAIEETTATAVVGEDYEPVISQCMDIVNSSEDVLYTVITRRSDGFSLIFTEAGWRQSELSGIWTPGDKGPRANFLPEIPSDLVNEEVFHVSHPFSHYGVDWGWIHLGMGLKNYHANLQSIYRIIGVLAVGGMIMGLIVSFIFARHLTRPILALQRFAQEVASGDYEHQVEVNSNDELGDLAASINTMTKNLVESRDRLASSIKRESDLREKEILLKEIHHRVKNNMQILSSLLRIQSRGTDDERLSTILRESETRIRSMGLIHERLYQSESISEIDFDQYARSLTTELQRVYTAGNGKRIGISVDIDDVRLGLDTALPCGLIINELVSNSFKYAFPNGHSGDIAVRMRPLGEGRYELEVRDNGIGYPDKNGGTHEKTNGNTNGNGNGNGNGKGNGKGNGSLGMRLVEMLVDQLDGEVELGATDPSGAGARALIHFSESNYKQRL